MNFPVFSQLAGNLAVRDEFARDCLLLRGVCEPSVPKRRRRMRLFCSANHSIEPGSHIAGRLGRQR